MTFKYVGISGFCLDYSGVKFFIGQNLIYRKILNYLRFTIFEKTIFFKFIKKNRKCCFCLGHISFFLRNIKKS